MNRPFATTASADCAATTAAIELQLAKLKLKLEAHKAQALSANANVYNENWGYAGDLRMVEADLADIITFIS